MESQTKTWSRTLRQALILLLCFALVAGASFLFTRGRPYAEHGLWGPAFQLTSHGLRIGFLHGVLFLLLFAPLFQVSRRLTAHLTWRTLLSGSLAMLPFFVYWGREINHHHMIFANNFLEPESIQLNSRLVAVFLGLAIALFALLYIGLRKRQPLQGVKLWGVLSLLGITGLVAFMGPVIAKQAVVREQPNVIFILVDALRADHLGCYEYERDTTPNIDRLAAESVIFTQAISHSTFTKTSIASLFTGKNPFEHGVYVGNLADDPDEIRSDVLGADHVTLAEAILETGMATSAFVENAQLRDFTGFGQGFLEYRDQSGRLEALHRRLFPWLDLVGRSHPFFTYIHYIDLHDPYRPIQPYDRIFGEPGSVYADVDFARWGDYLEQIRLGARELSESDLGQLRDLYDGQIRYMDDGIGRLLERLESLGLYENSMIILSSDHGDGFMEHGFISHSAYPYDELLRVPLIIKFPRGEHAGTLIEDQVRLIDLYPTILDLLGGKTPAGLSAKSLMPLLVDTEWMIEEDPLKHLAISEITSDIRVSGAAPMVSVRGFDTKYIHFPNRPDELYDLALDPGETTNILPSQSQEAEFYEELLQFIAEQRLLNAAKRVTLPDEMTERLRALGYL